MHRRRNHGSTGAPTRKFAVTTAKTRAILHDHRPVGLRQIPTRNVTGK